MIPKEEEQQERLQKTLARRGVASRRRAEEMITAGRVAVNGRVVRELGVKVRPQRDEIAVDGQVLALQPPPRYLLLHKPAGWITSVQDPQGRRTVMDLLDGVTERVFPVGRLDYATSGLLLLTNDGEMANALLHPSKEVEKIYVAEAEGRLAPAELDTLRRGVNLKEGRTAPARVKLLKNTSKGCLVQIAIHEGRNRQVRRMLKEVGHEVIHLKRVGFACLELGDLPLGQWRELTAAEVARLQRLTAQKTISRQRREEYRRR